MSELSVEETTNKTYRAKRRLFVDKGRERLVEEGSPEAAFLLAAEGQEVSEEDARKYGLVESGGEAATGSQDAAESGAPAGEVGRVEVRREAPLEREVGAPVDAGKTAVRKSSAKKSSKKR